MPHQENDQFQYEAVFHRNPGFQYERPGRTKPESADNVYLWLKHQFKGYESFTMEQRLRDKKKPILRLPAPKTIERAPLR